MLFFEYDADDDWKSVSPALPDPLVTTVTLTATDPGGLSATVSGDFLVWWDVPAQPEGFSVESGPGELEVSARWDYFKGWGIDEYRLSWRRVGGEYESGDVISLPSHSATVRVSGVGLWELRLEACNGLGCSPGVTRSVSVGIEPPDEVGNFALRATPGSLDVAASWDAVAGATSYNLAWRQADGEFETANASTVTATDATITLEDYGQWVVRLQGCNDAGCGPSITQQVEVEPPPNRAPAVNTQAAHYASFVGRQSAPRGSPVSKPFEDIFSDPDGDELTYAVTVPGDHSGLLDMLGANEASYRVGILVDADDDWKAVSPAFPDPLTITVTLTATDPDGLTASVSGDFVTDWDSHPALVSATASKQAVKLTFDQAVEADPAPAPGQFTVNVTDEDGSSGTVAVSSVSVSEKVITLELATALEKGQSITLDYAHDDDAPLTRAAASGDAAPGFTGQDVVVPPGVPENFSVSVTLGSLDVRARWDAVEGATSYKLRWRQAGGEFLAGNATTVTDTSATITVSGYGQWEVQLQACNDAGCVPEDDVPSVPLSLVPAREDQSESEGQSRGRVLSSTGASDPTGEAASYTVGWRRDGVNPQAPAQTQPDGSRQTRGASGPTAQSNTASPRLERGEIDGDTMTFHFSEALDEDAVGARFRVTLDWGTGWCEFTALPRRVVVSGNRVVVHGLSRRGWPGWERAQADHRVQAFYYKDDRAVPASQRLRDLDGNEVSTPQRKLGGRYPATRTIDLSNLTAAPPPPRRVPVPGRVPVLGHATAHPHWLTLTFDKVLARNSVPAGGAFTVKVNGSAVSLASVNPVILSGNIVRLFLASPLASTDNVTVSYAQPVASLLRGLDGAVASFPAQSVTNVVGVVPVVSEVAISSAPADGEVYAPGETIRVKVTFSEAVTVTGMPRLKIKLDPGYGEKWANYESGSGTAKLTFAYTVAEPDRSTHGVAVLRDTLDLNGGAIRSATTAATDAHLWYFGLGHNPVHMVEWLRSAPGVPRVTGVAVSSEPQTGNTYTLGETIAVTVTFSEAVDVDTAGGTPRLKIRMAPYLWWMNSGMSWMGTDHEERWADYAGGSGTTELTFNYTVLAENRSTQGVAVLRSGLDLSGSAIRSSTAPPEDANLRYEGLWHDRDHQVDGGAPALLTVAVAGTRVALTYGETLDWGSVPPASAFTVRRTPQGGTEETVSLSGPPAIAAGAVLLTLANPVLATDTGVKVSYGKPTAAADRLRDRAGNEAAGFTNQAADPTDTTPPQLVWGEIDGDTLTIYFNEALDEDSMGDGDYFRVTMEPRSQSPNFGQCPVGSFTFTIEPQDVYVRGNTAVLVGLGDFGPGRAIVEWQVVNLHYVADVTVARRLRDLSGNPVSTPNYKHYAGGNKWSTRHIRLENVTWLPTPESATVIGNRLTLTFDAPMDSGRRPAASAFTVKVNGSQVSLAGANAVSVSGRKVTLTLASPVAAGADVMVSYEKPASNWLLRNVLCEYAESFSDEPVGNFTGLSPATTAVTSTPSAANTYVVGDTIRVQLTFSEVVNVDGAPRLKISLGSEQGEKWAYYEGGSGTNSLTFAYRVALPDTSPQGIAVLSNTLDLKYGALRYASGDPAYLAHTGMGHNAGHKVDWRVAPPGVPSVSRVAVTSDPGDDDTYGLDETIRVTLTFSEAVNVDGAPRLIIRMNPDRRQSSANYESGSGTSSLTFTYQVVEPDISPRGIAVPEQWLNLNGGAIRSVATPTDAHLVVRKLGHDPNHKVDWRVPAPGVPSVSRVAVTSDPGDDDTYALGETIRVTLTFSEAVDVTGAPRLKIKMDPEQGEKWAAYESGSGNAELTFAYRVVEPDTSPRGIAVPEQWLNLNGGAIRSSAATATEAHLWYAGLDHDPDHKVDWRRRPQPPGSPSVTGLAISSEPDTGDTYTLGETIQVTLEFSEAVDVTGAPRLKIKMDPQWGEKWADYESGSGTNRLTFAYTVVEPNTSPRGIAVLTHSLQLNGGAIKSANTLIGTYLAHWGLGHDGDHRVDWRRSGDCEPPGGC